MRIVRDFDPQPQTVEGWAADLAMVWTNLLDNALAAVGQEGVVTVRTRGEADAVVVDVENTGPTGAPGGAGAGVRRLLHDQADRPGHRTRAWRRRWPSSPSGTRAGSTLTSEDGVTRARVVLPRHR